MEGWPYISHDPASLAAPRHGITLYDINGDGNQELITAFGNKLYCFNYIGELLPGFPYINSNQLEAFANSPVIGDIDGDGFPEIVADWQNIYGHYSKLIALNVDGSMCDGFPIDMANNNSFDQLCLYDMDNDGILEIIIGLSQHYPDILEEIRIYHGNGQMFPGWPVSNILTYGIAVGDIDNDGEGEVVVSGYERLEQRYDLFAFENDGTAINGFPVEFTYPPGNNYSRHAPVLFDKDDDGNLEIIQLYEHDDYYGCVAILNNSGQMIDPWPLEYNQDAHAGPSIAISSIDREKFISFGAVFFGNSFLVDMNAQIVNGWPFWSGDSSAGNYDQPAIGDIDGDGSLDFIFNYNMAVRDSLGRRMGRIWALDMYGELLDSFPLWVQGTTFPGGVSFGDVDNDGNVEMTFFTVDTPPGGRPTNRIFLYKFPGVSYESERFPWPMSCHDPQHTNNLTFRMPTAISDDEKTLLPREVVLSQNYPNPFNAVTTIDYNLNDDARVNLKIFNILGQEVNVLVDKHQKAGNHSVVWDASEFSSGIYYYKLTGNDISIVKNMMLMK
ncbi:MAG: T9SS type A sorting domain-containing protein [candidate division Zixibacteria bacterium]|nr:T9SS type A sorting domain-containing protein [candidate division Zixibacteria bacterium]